MERRMRSFVSAVALALGMLVGATAVAQTGEREIRSGVIEQITDVQMASNHHRGIGAVVGGVAGLGLGSLIGAGTGRDVAMVLGAVGGALTGNEIQKKRDQPEQGQQIIVRVTSGVLVMVTQPVNPSFVPGNPCTSKAAATARGSFRGGVRDAERVGRKQDRRPETNRGLPAQAPVGERGGSNFKVNKAVDQC